MLNIYCIHWAVLENLKQQQVTLPLLNKKSQNNKIPLINIYLKKRVLIHLSHKENIIHKINVILNGEINFVKARWNSEIWYPRWNCEVQCIVFALKKYYTNKLIKILIKCLLKRTGKKGQACNIFVLLKFKTDFTCNSMKLPFSFPNNWQALSVTSKNLPNRRPKDVFGLNSTFKFI